MRAILFSLAIFSSALMFSPAAIADCELDGESYPEGTKYGRYVCENGEWVRTDE